MSVYPSSRVTASNSSSPTPATPSVMKKVVRKIRRVCLSLFPLEFPAEWPPFGAYRLGGAEDGRATVLRR